MATFSVTFTLDTSKLDGIVENMDGRTREIIDENVSKMKDSAQAAAPVRTGALRDSIAYEMESDTSARLHDGVEYGVYQELGTSKMAAQPFFFQAVEQYMNTFFQSFRKLFE